MKLQMTYALAHAAATDAANRQAKKAGRIAWDIEDYSLACRTFEDLYPRYIVKYASKSPNSVGRTL